MRIEDALDRYLLQLEADGRSAHTIAQARRHVRLFARWAAGAGLSGEIEDVGHEDVARFLAGPAARRRPDGREKRASSANTLRSTLRTFLGYLHEAGHLPANPARLVRLARCSPPPPRGFSDEEQAKLLEALAGAKTAEEKRDRVIFEVMLGTGIRLGSAVALDVEDVDLERAELRLRKAKGGREDVVVLPRRLVGLVGEHARAMGSGAMFRSQGGQRVGGRHVRRRLAGWCRRAGVAARGPHALRHSFAARTYAVSGDILLTKTALKHRSIESTLVYARADDRRLRAVVDG